MSEFQAAMGICNLRHLHEEISKRKKVVEHYYERLSNIKGIKLCTEQLDVKSNYAYFPVLFDDYKYTRNEIYEMLKQNDIISRKYFYPLTNTFSCYKSFPTAGKEKTPRANYISEHILTLPLYSDISINDVDRICDIIQKNIKR